MKEETYNEEESEMDQVMDSYDDEYDNTLELDDIDILEKTEEETTLRLIISDGTWKKLVLKKEVIKQLM